MNHLRGHKRIGVDLDGVLADFNTPYAKRLGIELPPGGPTIWDYPKAMGVDYDVYTRVWDALALDDMFWRTLPEYPHTQDALDILGELRSQGHDIYFITSRPKNARMKAAAEQWLRSFHYEMPTVLMAWEKGALAAGLGLSHFIDDKPENVVDVRRARGNKAEVVLLDQPYNREFTHPYILRALDLVRYLHSLTD